MSFKNYPLDILLTESIIYLPNNSFQCVVKNNTKDVVAGLGEIGSPILNVISKATNTVGYDINPKLVDDALAKKFSHLPTRFLHICIPFDGKRFEKNILTICKKYDPRGIVIHSTIAVGTTKKLQNKLSIPVIYSATRGVHKRMIHDLKRYTKFFALEQNAPNRNWATAEYSSLMKKSGIKTKMMSNPTTLELAKIVVDTSYYGWLINYAQISNMIAQKHGVDYDEMWSFADEIHKFLGNRPKMFPGFIGGHCVVQNLDLIDDDRLSVIEEINNLYLKKVKNAKSIAKKYVKGKQSYDK
jgi:UDP-N-acetyl-D-mannosaminuronate dehydrogenase